MFLRVLPQLQAERQLAAIEASVFPHMKSEDAKRIAERHRRAAAPPEEPKPTALRLLDGFREHGIQVEHV